MTTTDLLRTFLRDRATTRHQRPGNACGTSRSAAVILRSVLLVTIAAVVASGVWAIDFWRHRPPERPPTYPVVGTLFVHGTPVGNASLAFYPVGDHAAASYRPVSSTNPDGSFSLMTYAHDDGAPEGEYIVTVLWIDWEQYDGCGDLLPHDRLRGLYADPSKSPLRAIVAAGTNEVSLAVTMTGGWNTPRQRDQVALQKHL